MSRLVTQDGGGLGRIVLALITWPLQQPKLSPLTLRSLKNLNSPDGII